MSDYTRLMARDGHQFEAWLAPPKGPVRGAVLVLQRSCAQQLASSSTLQQVDFTVLLKKQWRW